MMASCSWKKCSTNYSTTVFLPMQKADMLRKLLAFLIFADVEGRMNWWIDAIEGGLLLVSQFTLAAGDRSGMRPGFSTAAAPQVAEELFERFVGMAQRAWPQVV